MLTLIAFALVAVPTPDVEVHLTESVLTALLQAVAPFEADIEQDIPMLGRKKLHVTLTNPVVRIGRARLGGSFDYRVKEATGALELTGVATPEFSIRVLQDKNMIEIRLVQAGVGISGVQLPLQDVVDPIYLPASSPQELFVAGKTLVAEPQAKDVVLESGYARIKGIVTFKPALKPAAKTTR